MYEETALAAECAGLLAHVGLSQRRLQRLKFGFDSRDIGVDQVIEQAGLSRAECTPRYTICLTPDHAVRAISQRSSRRGIDR